MVTLELNHEEAKESIELLKAVIKPLDRSIAATDLAHRDYRHFLKKRRAIVDELLKRLEKNDKIELNDEEADESLAMLKDSIPVLDRSIAATDLAHRDYRLFLKKRRAIVDELIKRLEK